MDDETQRSGSRAGGPSARRWELAHAKQWLEMRRTPDGLSGRLAGRFREAVTRFFVGSVADSATAERVIAQLGPALDNCDDVGFNDVAQTLAYTVWHEVDRYYRVLHALDLLFESGVLPLAKPDRQLRVLEVGSGPAPASYAAADYYAALGAWSTANPDTLPISASIKAHTLDKGPAWNQLIHRLSEELSAAESSPKPDRASSGSWFFRVTYEQLQGFDPGEMHREGREHARRAMMDLRYDDDADPYWAWASMGIDLTDRNEIDHVAAQTAPPSAYDLIVLSNFLTKESMLTDLESELKTLARSLVPGGVLLTLSASTPKYQRMWDRFGALAEDCRLDHEVNEVVQAHEDPAIRDQVTGATVDMLLHLNGLAPDALRLAPIRHSVKAEFDAAMRAQEWVSNHSGDEPRVSYPKVQVHAFKRGHRAIGRRDRDRIARRRHY